MSFPKHSMLSDQNNQSLFRKKGPLVNGLFFNCIWVSMVAYGSFSLSIVLLMIWLQVNFKMLYLWQYVIICSTIGLIFDAILIQAGWLDFSNADQSAFSLMVLWLAFSFFTISFFTAFRLTATLVSILSVVLGPLSYFTAMKLGAVNIDWGNGMLTSVFLFFWLLAMPLMNLLLTRELSQT